MDSASFHLFCRDFDFCGLSAFFIVWFGAIYASRPLHLNRVGCISFFFSNSLCMLDLIDSWKKIEYGRK